MTADPSALAAKWRELVAAKCSCTPTYGAMGYEWGATGIAFCPKHDKAPRVASAFIGAVCMIIDDDVPELLEQPEVRDAFALLGEVLEEGT